LLLVTRGECILEIATTAIKETTDSILKEIIECKKCYRIVEDEYSLYRKLQMPIPSTCPKCREQRRFDLTNPPFSKETKCGKCDKEIKTKIVYCDKC